MSTGAVTSSRGKLPLVPVVHLAFVMGSLITVFRRLQEDYDWDKIGWESRSGHATLSILMTPKPCSYYF